MKSLEDGSTNLPANIKRDLASIELEIRKLWQKVNSPNEFFLYDVPFSFAGELFASESPRYYSPNAGLYLVQLWASLGTPGTSNTVVEVRKNGAAIATLTFGSGVQLKRTALQEIIQTGVDYLTMAVTGVGTGARDLDVQARFRIL